MDAINNKIDSYYHTSINSNTITCSFCDKVAKYNSSTKKGHLAGGQMAKHVGIASCTKCPVEIREEIAKAYADGLALKNNKRTSAIMIRDNDDYITQNSAQELMIASQKNADNSHMKKLKQGFLILKQVKLLHAFSIDVEYHLMQLSVKSSRICYIKLTNLQPVISHRQERIYLAHFWKKKILKQLMIAKKPYLVHLHHYLN